MPPRRAKRRGRALVEEIDDEIFCDPVVSEPISLVYLEAVFTELDKDGECNKVPNLLQLIFPNSSNNFKYYSRPSLQAN